MSNLIEGSNFHQNESIKENSRFLRGTILEGLADEVTGCLAADDTQLTKFHGIYQQDDRDARAERRRKKLEKAYSFMIRVRVPGGVCTPHQWLEMDRIARTYASGAIKLTTRQAFQFHGVIKSVLKRTMREINDSLLDTIAACGDVNRNVMCNPNPYESKHHGAAQKLAQDISDHLTPATKAYHEIWMDGEKVADSEEEHEPIYGKTYLPRKFKTVVAVPPMNDVDIFAHCLGFIAIVENDEVVGYNVTVGGGMGMTHGKEDTFPRLAEVMGFCTPKQAVDVAEKIVTVQRDYGERTQRHRARLKYTIETVGLKFFREEVERRLGYSLEEARPFEFTGTGDRFGWCEGVDGNWHYGLFVENGRVIDLPGVQMLTGLRKIAEVHDGDFRLTANQNVVIGQVKPENRGQIEALLEEYGLSNERVRTGMRYSSMACVALPTCGLALAESQRFLPELVDDLEQVIEANGLRNENIKIRMTGCPNGCARPYLGEIGLVGRGPGVYNLYLGAGFGGERLNKLYRRDVPEKLLLKVISPIIEAYARDRAEGEPFGDFTIRAGYVQATERGSEFHLNLPEEVDSVA
ncbi:MAG: NADPH-dependent assimilatory sulfite reductase hemoprotein subunit [Verrucomicrobiota bacterium]